MIRSKFPLSWSISVTEQSKGSQSCFSLTQGFCRLAQLGLVGCEVIAVDIELTFEMLEVGGVGCETHLQVSE